MAEVIPEHSPYAYTFNNPISFIDPTGMMGVGFASTIVDDDGKIIEHKDDGDPGIYLNSRKWENLIGIEQEDEIYSVGNYLSEDDLLPNVTLPSQFQIQHSYDELPVLGGSPGFGLLGPGGVWQTARYLGFFARFKVLFNKGTLKITVSTLGNVEKTTGFMKLIRTVESDAKSKGATKLIIEGVEILNPKLMKTEVFKRLGYSIDKITDSTVTISKTL